MPSMHWNDEILWDPRLRSALSDSLLIQFNPSAADPQELFNQNRLLVNSALKPIVLPDVRHWSK